MRSGMRTKVGFTLLLVGKAVFAQSTWILRSPNPTPYVLHDVAWSGKIAVAVGDSGTIPSTPPGAVTDSVSTGRRARCGRPDSSCPSQRRSAHVVTGGVARNGVAGGMLARFRKRGSKPQLRAGAR